MYAKRISFLLIAFSILFSADSFGQNATDSPYSRYGLGDIPFGGFAKNSGMGGMGIGYRPPYNINIVNPASYSALSLTTFEFAVSASVVQFNTTSLSQKKSDATFAYFALGFPVVKNKWGSVLGLVPFSNMGYTIKYTSTDVNAGNVSYTYDGSGGVNRFFIGNAVTLFKHFSAGVDASYLFGSLKHVGSAEFADINYFDSRFTGTTVIQDFYFNVGLQYSVDSLSKLVKGNTMKIKTDRSLIFGLTFSSPVNLSAKRDLLGERYNTSGSLTYVKDTVINTTAEKGIIELPYSVGFGFLYRKGNQLLFGADAVYQNWKDYSYFGQKDSLRNSLRISGGTQYTPDERAMNSYTKTIQYRFGLFYNQSYLQLKNSTIDEFGVTLGFGLPLRKGTSIIQLSAQFGRRGTTDNNLIREDFMRFTLEITFNDRWFIKPKYD